MFNRTAFNRTFFDRRFTIEKYGSLVAEGSGSLSATAVLVVRAVMSTMEGSGELTATPSRVIHDTALPLSAEGELTAAAVAELVAAAVLSAEGELAANASRYHIDEIIVYGPFAPGQRIVIDSQKMRVTQDGVMAPYDGEFPRLSPGDNALVYQDTASSRAVQIRITHRDKFD